MPPARGKAKPRKGSGPGPKSRRRRRTPSPTPSPPPIEISDEEEVEPEPEPEEVLLTLKCLYCKAKIAFQELPATGYVRHLRGHHKIDFDHDFIVNRTMEKQFPHLAKRSPSRSRSIAVQTNPLTSPSLLASANRRASSSSSASLSAKETKKEFENSRTSVKRRSESPAPARKKAVVLTKVRQCLPWFAGCEYRCKICQELYFLADDLRKHIRSGHQTTSDDYVDKHGTLETKTSYIKCRVCNGKVKQNFTAIANHIWLQHDNMLVETYQDRFKVKDRMVEIEVPRSAPSPEAKRPAAKPANRPGPKSAKRKREDLSNPSTTLKEVAVPLKRLKATDLSQETNSSRLSRRQWHQGYEYECRCCQSAVFYDPAELLAHAEDAHDLGEASYLYKYGKLPSKTRDTKCLICAQTLRHCTEDIRSHLEQAHDGMRLKAYEDCFGKARLRIDRDDEGAVSGREERDENFWVSDHEDEQEEEVEEVGRSGKKAKSSRTEEKVGKHKLKNAARVATENGEKDEIQVENDEDEEREDDTYTLDEFVRGGCTFQCSQCPASFHSSTEFWQHVESEHGTSADEYRSKHATSEYLTRQTKIECAVCYKIVRHEPGALGQHCGKAHGMTLEAFHKKYYDHAAAAAGSREEAEEADPGQEAGATKERFLRWWSQGSVNCTLCQKELHGGYSKHVQTCHGLTEAQYEAQYGPAPASGDVFKCRDCKKSFPFSRNGVTRHVLTIHGLTVEAYYLVYHEEPGPALRAWQLGCEICGKKIQDYGILQNHLKLAHKTSVEEYRRSYGEMMSKQVERSCELCNKAVLWYPWSIEKHLKSHGWTPAGFYYMKVAPPNWVGNKAGSGGSEGYQDGEKVEDFHKWKASGCQAECQVPGCDVTVSATSSFTMHLQSKHPELKLAEYKDQYRRGGSVFTRKRKLRCEECRALVLFEAVGFVGHLQAHGITLPAYFEKHARNKVWKLGETYFAGNEKGGPVKSAASASVPISTSTSAQGPLLPLPKSLQQLPLSLDGARSSPGLSGGAAMSENTCDPQTRRAYVAWRDQCVYRCGHCGSTHNTYMSLYSHLSSSHDHRMTMSEHSAKYGDHMAKEVKVQCPVCRRTVRAESSSWRGHAKTHRLTPFDIFQFFVLKPEKPLDAWKKSEYLQCLLCSFENPASEDALSQQNMASHVSLAHTGAEREALRELSQDSGGGSSGFVRRFKTHECMICGLRVQRSSEHLGKHMEALHGITAEEYSAGFLEKRLVLESDHGLVAPDFATWLKAPSDIVCQVCNLPCDSKTSLGEHLSLDHKTSLSDYCATHGEIDTAFFDCRICHQSVEKTQEAVVLHLADSEVHGQVSAEVYYEKYHVAEEGPPKRFVGRWEEGCRYECTMCRQDTDNLAHLRHHCIVEHDLTGKG